MAFEADWLEREERYRRRVVKLLALGFVVAGVAIGTIAVMHGRATRKTTVAAAAAAQATREAEQKRVRDAFVADSSAVANRNRDFTNRYGATLVSGTPIIQIPLPVGTGVAAYVQMLWPEYARVLDPQATPEQISEWYRKYYVDIMNDGPLRPSAILFPAIEQSGTKLSMERASFGQITAAQITVGMRIPAPPDTTEMMGAPIEPAFSPTPTPTPAPGATEAPAATIADIPEIPIQLTPPPSEPAVEPTLPDSAPPDSAANGLRS